MRPNLAQTSATNGEPSWSRWDDELEPSNAETRAVLLRALVVALVRASLRPLDEKDVVEEAMLLVDRSWAVVSKGEVAAALDALDSDECLNRDLAGRHMAARMPRSIDETLEFRLNAARLLDVLEETEAPADATYRNVQLKSLYSAPLLDADEERELAWARDHGDRSARNRLIEANTRLGLSVSRAVFRGRAPGFDEDDAFQEACVGLCRAATKFEANRGFKFSTYATWWIRQAVTRAWADKARTIRLPVHIDERVRILAAAERRGLSDAEAAGVVGVSGSGLASLRDVAAIEAVPLDQMTRAEAADASMRASAGDAEETDWRIDLAVVRKAMDTLPARERRVIELRFGFDGGESMTLDAIGQVLEVTRERVRQVENEAKKRLRSLREIDALRPDATR